MISAAKQCPAKDCDVRIASSRPACMKHYYSLPEALQVALHDARVRKDDETYARLVDRAIEILK